jgi:outer membrane protein insertion porin family
MTGVRRASRRSGVLGTATIRGIALALAAFIASGASPSRSLPADEPAPGFRPAGAAKLPRNIRQTASPLRDDQTGETPSSDPARSERLTGLDPEIENLTEPLADVLIEGNKTIESSEILKKIKTRPGRQPDPKVIKEDILSRWFFQVTARVAFPKSGPVLVFKVVERPILKKVVFKGNKKIKTKELVEMTGLKEGGAFEVGANKESARRIENQYREKGYMHAQVELEKGGSPDDREAIFNITEGPKVHVGRARVQTVCRAS